MRSLFAVISFQMLFLSARAGEKDTAVLRKFEMIASKDHSHTGVVRTNIPLINGSLADMLVAGSALFVKQYGPSGLASVSMRGLGAQHTAVMWNGINLQSSMNSSFDLNLIPAFFMDEVAIETGAGSGSCTNGALSGAVVMQNRIASDKDIRVEMLTGSFGRMMAGASASYKFGNSKFRTRFLHRRSVNDYPFTNVFLPGNPQENLQNAMFRQNGVMQEWQTDAGNHSFYSGICFLDAQRQLPDAIGTADLARARQDDQNLFFFMRHRMEMKKGITWQNRMFYLGEKIDYYNNLISPALNTSRTLQLESEMGGKIRRRIHFTGSVQISRQKAEADGYRNGHQRWMFSGYTAFSRTGTGKYNFRWTLANRILSSGMKSFPLNPEFGAECRILPSVLFKVHTSVSSRIPGFNDLYWKPGGNPDLLPERGKKAEFSLEFNRKSFKAAATAFRNRVSNWIIWLPANGGIWTAYNAKQVDSRGIECSAETIFGTSRIQYRMFGRYQYVKSVNTKAYPELNSSVGKQLFYTPRHTGFAQFEMGFLKYRLQSGMTYTGTRFTTADNNPAYLLDAYALIHLSISGDFKFRKHNITFQSGVNNMLNTGYEIVEFRPMPGRHYYFRLIYYIQYEK